MLKQGGGAIVSTSSGAGVKGFKGGAAYVAAKHGVMGLTKTAALDYAQSNIRINAICPEIIETPMMHRFSGCTDEGRQAVITRILHVFYTSISVSDRLLFFLQIQIEIRQIIICF